VKDVALIDPVAYDKVNEIADGLLPSLVQLLSDGARISFVFG
jgi:hypothetical protein